MAYPPLSETPPSSYWKEVAEERRKALYSVLQENEKVSTSLMKADCLAINLSLSHGAICQNQSLWHNGCWSVSEMSVFHILVEF